MNSGKLYLNGNKYDHFWANIGEDKIWESKTLKLLGITIKKEFKIEELISNVFAKVQGKPTELMKISK